MTSMSSEIHSDRKTRNHDIMYHFNICFYHILTSSVIYFEQTHDKMESVFVKSIIEMTSKFSKVKSELRVAGKSGFTAKI